MGKKKKQTQKKLSVSEERLVMGLKLLSATPLFGRMRADIRKEEKQRLGCQTAAITDSCGTIYVNQDMLLTPKQWVFVIAHCQLHLAFGHFDAEHMPSYPRKMPDGTFQNKVCIQPFLWNEACDLYIDRFLSDLKIGELLCDLNARPLPGGPKTELQIYEYLLENHPGSTEQYYGTAAPSRCDMAGLSSPRIYDSSKGESNQYAAEFAYLMAECAANAVSESGGHTARRLSSNTPAEKAAKWFIDHYPLLGALASHFKILESYDYCYRNDIHIAAIDIEAGEIYINPACGYRMAEWQFVLAHEYLHAGLEHGKRCQGRDPYLWNVACDFVINGWLLEMQIGEMPQDGLLYDATLKGMSAESIYDRMLLDIRRYQKKDTFHGNGKGDILTGGTKSGSLLPAKSDTVSLDDFCREALMQGLQFHQSNGRGYLPAGLIEEIKALSAPPVPWDVKLAEWFTVHFSPLERRRTYGRPSRRQACTPDIPRPRCVYADIPENSRTFGVVIDTSGSMGTKDIGMALGAVASYAAAREVPYARVVFCDAAAYDAGYLSVEEIAGRVNVKGRGGTVLQPAIDLLERAEDFPKDGPVLIITDGDIEPRLLVRRVHAYLIPWGKRLPFSAGGEVFYFKG